MLKIKLIRYGKKDQPHYRFVVQEAKTKRDGKYTAAIGHYAPTQKPKILKIDLEAYQAWLKKGAQPTETVASLVKRYQSEEPFPPKKKKPSKKKQAAAEKSKANTEKKEKDETQEEAPTSAEETSAEEKVGVEKEEKKEKETKENQEQKETKKENKAEEKKEK